ncbi:LuxR family transcriptional regulator [Pantoea sp. GD03673]|uniref:helix-turn-helix transcriptional regulator n=1 Tax=Pantoea sp. GD03673 TaxID=2975364 RepID=UPI002448EEBF|nr:LuxR family transcriptional regulator [Pantoea sp. GD03673]MDH2069260.1 LuxR C-terminal-related transcriptional regulator [Pantoea sp. GD03673]
MEKMDFNIFCTDGNYYFKLGISKIIEGALLSDVNVKFLSGSVDDRLQKADLILINFSKWRLYMCHPAYRNRKPGSAIIVFVDKKDEIIASQLPVCYQSLIVFSRKDSVRLISEKITEVLLTREERSGGFVPTDCLNCNYSHITVVQLQVLSLLKKGYSAGHAAKRLHLSSKTIYAHKYNVMRKFSLKGDKEFNAFINDLSLLELYNGVINEG